MNLYSLRQQILNYFQLHQLEALSYQRELKRLKELEVVSFESLVFPYEFVDRYQGDYLVNRDEDSYPYIITKSGPLFFPKEWSDEAVLYNFKLLQIEQHETSPHHYIKLDESGGVILDIGCAEGNFSFYNYYPNSEYHLFDDSNFREVIHKTFKDKDNVIYHNKFVSLDYPIDKINFNNKVKLIKVDVEGSEYEVLVSAVNTILRDKPVLQICTYHNQGDFTLLYNLIKSFGYSKIVASKGYMLFPNSFQEPPYFRTGLIYAY